MPPEEAFEEFEPTGHAPADNILQSRLYVKPKVSASSFSRGLRARVSEFLCLYLCFLRPLAALGFTKGLSIPSGNSFTMLTIDTS